MIKNYTDHFGKELKRCFQAGQKLFLGMNFHLGFEAFFLMMKIFLG